MKPGIESVQTDQLQVGMYVSALDRDWEQTPFPRSGFYISSAEDIEELRAFCRFVYVDLKRSRKEQADRLRGRQGKRMSLPPLHDAATAGKALASAAEGVRSMMASVRRGELIRPGVLKRQIRPMIRLVRHSPDALLWMLRTEPPEGYLYRRALGTAVQLACVGGHLGFDEEVLSELALGGLLLDVGKVGVPVPLLVKPGTLTDGERQYLRQHVDRSFAILRMADQIEPRVLSMVQWHHERLDGSGYPDGLKGTEIPFFARLAGVVDTYDAMTQQRHYAPPVSGHEALAYLRQEKGRRYDSSVVDELIDTMGPYPTGSLVELTDGSIGIVFCQNPGWPLEPGVALLTEPNRKPVRFPRLIQPGRDNAILRVLDPDAVRPGRVVLASVMGL